MALVVKATKDPDNIEPFYMVWCDKLGTNVSGDNGELQGATISTATWTVPTGITKTTDNLLAVTIDGTAYAVNTVGTIWLSGGTAGTSYSIGCKITTSDSRTLDQSMIIYVEAA